MNRNRPRGLAGGVVLIVLGAALLLAQLLPGWSRWLGGEHAWPLIVVAVGAGLLVLAVAANTPALAIPGCIVGGIGGLLFYRNASGDWASWAYAWTLIPGFVGVGILVAGLLEGAVRPALSPGLWMIFISLVSFLVFAAFLGFGRDTLLGRLGDYWPLLLVLGGLLLLARGLFRRKA